MPDGKIQHDHLRILQLHKTVAGFFVRQFLDPESGVHQGGLRIFFLLRLAANVDRLAVEEVNVFDASAKLRQ